MGEETGRSSDPNFDQIGYPRRPRSASRAGFIRSLAPLVAIPFHGPTTVPAAGLPHALPATGVGVFRPAVGPHAVSRLSGGRTRRERVRPRGPAGELGHLALPLRRGGGRAASDEHPHV